MLRVACWSVRGVSSFSADCLGLWSPGSASKRSLFNDGSILLSILSIYIQIAGIYADTDTLTGTARVYLLYRYEIK